MRKNKLREWRKKLEFTQAELAMAAHCSRATIIWIERLGHYPTPGVRQRIAVALFVSEKALWPANGQEGSDAG